MPSTTTLLSLPAFLATLALARTDLSGCTSTDVSSPAGASIAWYVPGTGELCDFLDCGGGMAPPKTNVPGCPLYSGTATYSPSFMPGWGSATAAASATSSAAASTSAAVVSVTGDSRSAMTPVPYGSYTPSGASMAMSQSTSVDWSSLASAAGTETSSWDLYTDTTAGASSTASAASSTASATSSTSSAASSAANTSATAVGGVSVMSSSTLSTSTTAMVASNGTAATGGASGPARNGTSPSATGSSSAQPTSGAVVGAKAWMGSASLMVGLGAVVAML